MAAIATSLSPVVLAVEKTEATTELAPVVVKGIRPLLKIAEHPVVEPRYGAAVVAEGEIVKWLVEVGETIKEDQPMV